MILTCNLKFICDLMIISFQYDERDYSVHPFLIRPNLSHLHSVIFLLANTNCLLCVLFAAFSSLQPLSPYWKLIFIKSQINFNLQVSIIYLFKITGKRRAKYSLSNRLPFFSQYTRNSCDVTNMFLAYNFRYLNLFISA